MEQQPREGVNSLHRGRCRLPPLSGDTGYASALYRTRVKNDAQTMNLFWCDLYLEKRTGKSSCETAYGITSCSPEEANAQTVLATNRAHWIIENRCHCIIDWSYDEDRGRIRTGYSPEDITRLRTTTRLAPVGIAEALSCSCACS